VRARSAVIAAVALALALAAAGCGSSTGASSPASSSSASSSSAAAASPARASTTCAAAAPAPRSHLAGAPLDTILRVPASARGHRAPLLLALHFASGTGAEMEQTSRYTPQARKAGFVVAYPTASQDHFWDPANDLDKLAATIDAAERAACIDPRRVYISGISNGGSIATVMACRMADRIAAEALFAPAVGDTQDCSPARAMPMLEIHGTADPIVPYGGVPPFLAGWVRRDGCENVAHATPLGSPSLTRVTWKGCRDGVEVQHLRLTGGRHIELLDELRAAGIDPARQAWAFLARYRLAR